MALCKSNRNIYGEIETPVAKWKHPQHNTNKKRTQISTAEVGKVTCLIQTHPVLYASAKVMSYAKALWFAQNPT